jgi:Trypsin-co-occurring domain 1
MRELLEFHLEDGRSVLFEVNEDEPGVERAARDDLVIQASKSLEEALDSVRSVADVTFQKLREFVREPDELEVQFGIRLNAQAGAVIAKTEAEGHFQVRLAWSKPR